MIDYEEQEQDPKGLNHFKLVAMAICLLVLVVSLLGCAPSTSNVEHRYAIPESLKDCSFFKMANGSGTYLHVVRCPNSSVTAYTGGKTSTTTITIDGVEYERKNIKNEISR